MIKPITPSEVGFKKISVIPPEIIEAFNEEIALHFTCGRAVVYQKDIVNKVVAKLGTEIRFDHNWLNIEEMYQAAGWKVRYDKPSYCESHHAFFEFEVK